MKSVYNEKRYLNGDVEAIKHFEQIRKTYKENIDKSLEDNKDKAAEFYTRIGNMAKEKGIVISLITFEDSESEIYILIIHQQYNLNKYYSL